MHRTQIYLDDDEVALLTQASARTDASRSELIRRAVHSQYGIDTPEDRLAALRGYGPATALLEDLVSHESVVASELTRFELLSQGGKCI